MALVSAGLGYLGAKKSASAARGAANAQIRFAEETRDLAEQEAERAFNQTRRQVNRSFRDENAIARDQMAAANPIIDATETAAVTPLNEYAEAGSSANAARLYELGLGAKPADYAGFEGSPGFEFAKNEGIRSIDASAASAGGLHSGATLRALAGYTTGLAQQDFGNHMSRLSNVAGAGQQAAGQISDLRRLAGSARLGASDRFYGDRRTSRIAKGDGLVSAIAGRSNTRLGYGADALRRIGDATAQSSLAQGAAFNSGLQSAAGGFNNTLRLLGGWG